MNLNKRMQRIGHPMGDKLSATRYVQEENDAPWRGYQEKFLWLWVCHPPAHDLGWITVPLWTSTGFIFCIIWNEGKRLIELRIQDVCWVTLTRELKWRWPCYHDCDHRVCSLKPQSPITSLERVRDRWTITSPHQTQVRMGPVFPQTSSKALASSLCHTNTPLSMTEKPHTKGVVTFGSLFWAIGS